MYCKHTLILMATIIMIGCQSTRIIPDTPAMGNFPEPPDRLASQISLPLEIDISTVESLVNAKLPNGKIAGDSKKKGNTISYSYSIYRNRPVKFTAEGDELVFKVPIDIKARGSYTACVGFWRDGDCCSTPKPFGKGCLTPGVTTTEHGEASPSVEVELRIKLAIQEDYTIKTQTYLKAGLSDTHLRVDLIGDLVKIKINIKDKLEKPLQKFVKDYQKEIDQKVTELVSNYDIKKEIARYWKKVKQPIKLDNLWLDVQPEKVLFENLNAANGKLRIGLGFETTLEVSTTKPIPSNAPLPNLTFTEGTKGVFNIYLPAITSFNYLETLAKKEVIGKMYEKDGVWVQLTNLDIRGSQLNNSSLILVKAQVKGKAKFKRFKGDIYFTAKPTIDNESKVVAVEDFQLETKTNSFLINNGLTFLVDKFYYDEIRQKMKYSYRSDYDKYLKLINEKMREIKIDQLVINGELESLEVPGFYVDKDNLELLLIGRGILNSRLELGEL